MAKFAAGEPVPYDPDFIRETLRGVPVSLVVDASIVFRLLANVQGDDLLPQRLARKVRAPALIDVEIASVVRGHAITSRPEVRISEARARIMLERYAQIKIIRRPMVPLRRRVLELLGVPLLTDDAQFAGSAGRRAQIHRYPRPRCEAGAASWVRRAG
jgi:predicted nucleic acid-binding protein